MTDFVGLLVCQFAYRNTQIIKSKTVSLSDRQIYQYNVNKENRRLSGNFFSDNKRVCDDKDGIIW